VSAESLPPCFVFQRPGRFRWVYAKPYEQVIVGDGERLYLYDKHLNQVTVKKLAGALPASPASILFGSNDFERDFAVKNSGEREGLSWIEATPRAKDSPFAKIEIGFRDSLPGAMRLTDSFGQVSLLVFAKLERNPRVAADTFQFKPPAGADVLQENWSVAAGPADERRLNCSKCRLRPRKRLVLVKAPATKLISRGWAG